MNLVSIWRKNDPFRTSSAELNKPKVFDALSDDMKSHLVKAQLDINSKFLGMDRVEIEKFSMYAPVVAEEFLPELIKQCRAISAEPREKTRIERLEDLGHSIWFAVSHAFSLRFSWPPRKDFFSEEPRSFPERFKIWKKRMGDRFEIYIGDDLDLGRHYPVYAHLTAYEVADVYDVSVGIDAAFENGPIVKGQYFGPFNNRRQIRKWRRILNCVMQAQGSRYGLRIRVSEIQNLKEAETFLRAVDQQIVREWGAQREYESNLARVFPELAPEPRSTDSNCIN